MKAAAVTTLIIAAIAFHAADAAAQSHFEAVPSVTVGSLYDDNLFAQAQGDAGHMLTVRQGLGTAIDTPRLNVSSLFTFDSQHSNHRDLTMIDARRHADTTHPLSHDQRDHPRHDGAVRPHGDARRDQPRDGHPERSPAGATLGGVAELRPSRSVRIRASPGPTTGWPRAWSTTAPAGCRSCAPGLSQIVSRALGGDRRRPWNGISPTRPDATNASDSVRGARRLGSPVLAVVAFLDPGRSAHLVIPRPRSLK